MNFYEFYDLIANAIDVHFEKIDTWFDKTAELRTYKPKNGGWNVNDILEHVMLTNHYLLILIDKGKVKALKKEEKVNPDDIHYSERGLTEFEEIGVHNSFYWPRPAHMEPTGTADFHVIRNKLKEQKVQCLETLQSLEEGQGILVKTKMSVHDLGKLDVYEYIYFLALHAKRHVEQMTKIETEYNHTK